MDISKSDYEMGDLLVEVESEHRERICLNGIWDIALERCQDESSWGAIYVPGVWHENPPWVKRPGMVRRGTGPVWEQGEKAFSSIRKAVYKRAIRAPEAWEGRSIWLVVERQLPEASIYVDGRACGRMDPWRGELEVTDYLNPGEEAILEIELENSYGLSADVFLICRPRSSYIRETWIVTSVRESRIFLSVELVNRCGIGTACLTAEILDERGEVERSFKAPGLELTGSGIETVRLSWPWERPRLWDVGQPNLYTLRLTMEAPGFRDCLLQRFGFREFWIEGKSFFLNGTEIRLRPVLAGETSNIEQIDGAIDGYLWAGYNLAELWPRAGMEEECMLWAERADLKGFPITVPAGAIEPYFRRWEDPAARKEYEEKLVAEIRWARNHPSILMYGTNANKFGSGLGMDPRHLGMRKDPWYDTAYYRSKRAPIGDEIVEMFHKHDPSRPMFTHHGGGVGDVHTLNFYLNMTPLQEREEWLTHWASQEDRLPFLIVEFGTPLHVTFMRGRTDFGDAIVTEPWLTEFSAIYLGTKAYELETGEYREEIRSSFIEGQKYKSCHMKPVYDFAPTMQEVLRLFNRNTWRSWRTMGMTGGMIPWNHGHGWGSGPHSRETLDLGPLRPGRRGDYTPSATKEQLYAFRPEGTVIHPSGQAIIDNNGPTLAWISGSGKAFTAKDHHYAAGAAVEKQAVLINDSRQRLPYACIIRVISSGVEWFRQEESGELETGTTHFIPFRFLVPEELLDSNKVQAAEIQLTARIGTFEHEDVFPLTAFQSRATLKGMTVSLFDPVGITREALAKLDCGIKDWTGESTDRLVMIGSQVLSGGHAHILSDLERHVREGGRALVMTQHPDWLREQLGFRVSRHVTRRAFRVAQQHPALQGLTDEEFRDWTGESHLLVPYPVYEPGQTKLGKWWFPYYGYHWGNRGGVSSAAVEKPHRSSWTPLLECEFDLAYTPLMELGYGEGRIVLCTLDAEDHLDEDPVAGIVLKQLIECVGEGVPKASLSVLIGGPKDAALLDSLGLVYEQREELPPSGVGLVLVGAESTIPDEELERYLTLGGRAFLLPRPAGASLLGVRCEEAPAMHGSTRVPDWKECEGISASDLRWKTNQPAVIIASGAETGADGLLARKAVGSGIALFCQLDPNRFDADRQTYFRFTRWRQTRALCQLLSNMGAVFTADASFFRPRRQPSISLDGPWRGAIVPPGQSVAPESLEWTELQMPQSWEQLGEPWADYGRDIILERKVVLAQEWLDRDLLLFLGKIDDTDSTTFNGFRISDTDEIHWPHNHPRVYTVPAECLCLGENTIRIRLHDRAKVFDNMYGGGLCALPGEMRLVQKQGEQDPGLYYYDYREDYILGDEPYRYFNW